MKICKTDTKIKKSVVDKLWTKAIMDSKSAHDVVYIFAKLIQKHIKDKK